MSNEADPLVIAAELGDALGSDLHLLAFFHLIVLGDLMKPA